MLVLVIVAQENGYFINNLQISFPDHISPIYGTLIFL